MVHKKYIKRGDKVFGPYLYENYRQGSVTKTRYLGPVIKQKKFKIDKNFLKAVAIITFVIIISLMILVPDKLHLNKISLIKEELLSQKSFGVFVKVIGSTNHPPIINVLENFYVC